MLTEKKTYANSDKDKYIELPKLAAISSKDIQHCTFSMNFKRIFDICFGLLLLPIILPAILMSAGLILVFMGKPIFFRQIRIGQNAKEFNMIKLRTMKINDGKKEVTENDGRITTLGKILRKFRLDETPQIINVFKGDMSIIGPRPIPKDVMIRDEYQIKIPNYHLRHALKPGITGWAQVHQGHVVGIADNILKQQYDAFYVQNHSFLLDLKILFLTIKVVLTGDKAK